MKLGLFGGSFDPIHRGHVDPVREAVAELGLERVYYLPTGRPPHKPDRLLAPPLARYAMAELALLDEPRLWVSPFEISGDEPHYTVETVLHFHASQPDAELVLLLGGDAFRDFALYYRWQTIVEHTSLGVLGRPGSDLSELVAESPWHRTMVESGRAVMLRNRPLAISSTAIRDALAAGRRPPADQVSPAVVDFVLKYGLYSKSATSRPHVSPQGD